MENIELQPFGERVKGILKELDWTQNILAKRIGVTQSTLSRLLDGKIQMTRSHAERLADALGFTLEKLFEGTDQRDIPKAPEIVRGALEQANSDLAEERADNERLYIESGALKKENERLTAELRERPRKEELQEVREQLSKVESQRDEFQVRFKEEEKKRQSEEKAKNTALRERDEANNRETALLNERFKLRIGLQEAGRLVKRLESEKDGLTDRLKDAYEERDQAKALIEQYMAEIEKLKKDDSSLWLGGLLGLGAGYAAFSKKKRR